MQLERIDYIYYLFFCLILSYWSLIYFSRLFFEIDIQLFAILNIYYFET